LPAGTYTITVAVFDSTWTTPYVTNNSAGTLAVQTAAPAPPPATGFTVASSASPSPVSGGGTLTAVTSVQSGAAASGIIVDVNVYDGAGNRWAQQAYQGQDFTAGQTRSYTWNWTVPAGLPPGSYAVQVGIWDASWTTQYSSTYPAATFSVQ